MTLISLAGVPLVLAAQWLTGAVLWRFLRGKPLGFVELLGVGLALGTITATISSAVLRAGFLGQWGWLVPTAVAAVLLIVSSLRQGRVGVKNFFARDDTGTRRAMVIGVLVGLIPLAVNWRRVPLSRVTNESFLDVYFLEALTRGLSNFGPSESILMTGGTIRYHWLSYIWAGDIATITALPPFASITRILPLAALVAVVALTATWAARLARGRSGTSWIPTAAVLLVVAGGYTGALYGTVLNFDSPSQSFTTMWLLALLLSVAVYVDRSSPWMLLAVALLAVANTGGKVSHIAVAAGGLILLSIVGIFTRSSWLRRAIAATAVSGLAAIGTYVVVIFGAAVDRNLTEELAVKASTWQGLDPLPGTWGVAAGTIALLLAAYARLAGIGWLVREREFRTNPSLLMAVGAVTVGTFAIVVLSEGINETWFMLAASAPASVVSAVGAVSALYWLAEQRGSLPWAVGAVAVLVAGVSLVLSFDPFGESATGFARWGAAVAPWLLAPVLSWALLVVPLRRKRGREFWLSVVAATIVVLVASSLLTRPATAWTSGRQVVTEVGVMQPAAITDGPASGATGGPVPVEDRISAARWLEMNAATDDIVATTNESSAFIPAYTGLRMFLAGSRYQVGLGNASDIAEIERRSAIISELREGSPEAVEQALTELCNASVSWLWWEGPVPEIFASHTVFGRSGLAIVDVQSLCEIGG